MTRKSNVERARRYVDFQQALTDWELAREYQGERLSESELAEQLGVRPVDGRIRGSDLVYACLHVVLNPDLQSLPQPKRLQIISSAMDILGELDDLWSRRGKAHPPDSCWRSNTRKTIDGI